MAASERPTGTERDTLAPSEPHVPGAGAARLAEILGWDHAPALTSEEKRHADERLAAAQAEARRVYGLTQDAA